MSPVQRGLVYVKTHKTGGSTLLNIILRISITLNLTCTPPANGHKGYGCPRTLPSTLANLPVSTVFAQRVLPGQVLRIIKTYGDAISAHTCFFQVDIPLAFESGTQENFIAALMGVIQP